jgi:hypothetical protein
MVGACGCPAVKYLQVSLVPRSIASAGLYRGYQVYAAPIAGAILYIWSGSKEYLTEW